MSWLLKEINQQTAHGTTTSTTDTPGTGTGQNTKGEQTDTSTRTETISTNGSRSSSNTIDTAGTVNAKSHFAMQVHIEIPIHNRQPVASS